MALHSFQLTDEELLAVNRRPSRSYNRPDPSDALAWAAWQQRSIPTETRKVAEHLHSWGETVCPICELPIDVALRHPHPESAQVDHVVPRSSGGSHTWANVRLTHRQCNMERSDGTIPEPPPVLARFLLRRALERASDPEAFVPTEFESIRERALFAEAQRKELLRQLKDTFGNEPREGLPEKVISFMAYREERVAELVAILIPAQATLVVELEAAEGWQ